MYISSQTFPEGSEPKTLQVALIGRDGFVLASDTRATTGGFNAIRRSSDVRKILLSSSGSLVCAYSGDDLAKMIAQGLIDSAPATFPDNGTLRAHLEQSEWLANKFGGNRAGQLIIVGVPNAAQTVDKLWQVSFQDNVSSPRITEIQTRSYGGDPNNSAVFISEVYHRRDKWVDELKLLAACVIVGGHKVNATAVHGLDVLIAKDGAAPTFARPAELQDLETRSAVVYASLGNYFSL